MPRPWTLVESVKTPDGVLELRSRGEREFMISHGGRVLMTSAYHHSELAVARLGCAQVADRRRPRVLIGGAGLGYTLRAALDALPADAQVTVAELNPIVLRWCAGPLAVLTDNALGDIRTRAHTADVMQWVRSGPSAGQSWDAIVVDLYLGPDEQPGADRHPLYGVCAVRDLYNSLSPGGVYAVWGEERSPSFEKRLQRVGFHVRTERTAGSGPHHVIVTAQRPEPGPLRSNRAPQQRSRRSPGRRGRH